MRLLITHEIFMVICSITNYQVNTQKFSKDYLLEINGNEADAKYFGRKFGYRFHHEIMPGKYVLRKTEKEEMNHSINRRSLSSIRRDSKVIRFEQQPYLKRYHRTTGLFFNDVMWNSMWYINMKQSIPSMNIVEAWQAGYTGRGIQIAVVDNGVQTRHIDLSKNYIGGYDYFDLDGDPNPDSGQNHGTKCAGIITAEANNTACVMGIAFDGQLIGLRAMDDNYGSTPTAESSALTYRANDIHIYSNSWGVRDGTGYEGPPSLVESAIIRGVTYGRKGKGSIYVWAAGNGGSRDNCNCDGYANSIYTISISGAGQDMYSSYYAEQCAAVLATTYGSDDLLYNVKSTVLNNGCGNFTGTSANAPLAAGIIALVLQANSNLTWRDVQHLIVKTSQKHSFKDRDWTTNGVGRSISSYFGYGLMDAKRMVDEAKGWKLVPLRQHLCVSETRSLNIHIAGTNRTATDSVISNGCNGTGGLTEVHFLEHVQVKISFSADAHKWVEFVLTSPSGTSSTLLSNRPDDLGKGQIQWTFMSVHFWGEDPEGRWTLKMNIVDPGTDGTLISWNLKLRGTKTDPDLGRIEDETEMSTVQTVSNIIDSIWQTTTLESVLWWFGIYLGVFWVIPVLLLIIYLIYKYCKRQNSCRFVAWLKKTKFSTVCPSVATANTGNVHHALNTRQ